MPLRPMARRSAQPTAVARPPRWNGRAVCRHAGKRTGIPAARPPQRSRPVPPSSGAPPAPRPRQGLPRPARRPRRSHRSSRGSSTPRRLLVGRDVRFRSPRCRRPRRSRSRWRTSAPRPPCSWCEIRPRCSSSGTSGASWSAVRRSDSPSPGCSSASSVTSGWSGAWSYRCGRGARTSRGCGGSLRRRGGTARPRGLDLPEGAGRPSPPAARRSLERLEVRTLRRLVGRIGRGGQPVQ
jgi:hypothetical protein